MRAPAHHRYTWETYLSIERESPIKHEFLDGEIFAMAGGTPEHAALGAAVLGELRVQLKGRPCRVFTSDLRVKVPTTGLTTYPDATVICGEIQRDPSASDVVVNPTLVVEVTSDSTETYDRGEKFEHFQAIPSLTEYVLVSHRERLIEVYRRSSDGTWSRSEARTGSRAQLASIGCVLEVDAVYEGIELHRG
jgi:Uma2 family endonuclease